MKTKTSDARTLHALRTLVREVVHPAIEKAKAQSAASGIPADVVASAHPSVSSAGQGTSGGQKPPGVMAPKAPVQDTAAKKQTAGSGAQGYRVSSGARKGTAIGHEGNKTIVKWDDDGTTSQEQGSSLQDLKEFLRLAVHENVHAGDRPTVGVTVDDATMTITIAGDLASGGTSLVPAINSALRGRGMARRARRTGRVVASPSHVVIDITGITALGRQGIDLVIGACRLAPGEITIRATRTWARTLKLLARREDFPVDVVNERLDTLVVDLEAPGPAGVADLPRITRERYGDITAAPLDPVDDVDEFDPGDSSGHHDLAGPMQR